MLTTTDSNMCGFVYMKRKDGRPAYKSVLKRYRAQKARGTQGFGYVAIENDHIVSYQRAETEHEIVNLISKEKASEILFHHRQPTGTPNMTELAHPFLIENSLLDHQYFVAHNGVIRNTGDLKDAHEKMGIEYTSEMLKAYITKQGEQHVTGISWNDSESLAIETALALDGKKSRIDTEGPAAVIGLQTKGKKIVNRFFFRNILNPLKWHEDNIMISITSTGEGIVIPPEKIFALNPTGGGYGILSDRFQPFLPYKPTPLYTSQRDGYWDNTKKEWVKHRKEGMSDTTMGFLRDGMKHVNDLLGLPSYADSDDERYVQDYDDDIERLTWETEAVLAEMTIAELWTEHDLSVAKEKELKEKLAKIDSLTKYTMEDLNKKEDLQNQFDERDKWTQAVMDEIVDRNSRDAEERTSDERMFK